MYRFPVILIFLSIILLTACRDKVSDRRLLDVAEIVSDHPEEAMKSLDSINTDKLSEADRNFYDLMTIKARDKAYIDHTSDSLILKVIDYATAHNCDYLAEAMYYGGRVYSDIGDRPTALDYFQNALELLPPDTDKLYLKSCVLSQTGRLLQSLRLFDEAIPYIESAIEIERQINDSLGLVYDLQLLGATCLRAAKYDAAEKYIKESIIAAEGMDEEHIATSRMFLAGIKFYKGDYDSAKIIIRSVNDNLLSSGYNTYLAFATRIYLKSGIYDTSFYYAKSLISNEDKLNKEIGYFVLLKPQLRNYSHQDTLYNYIYEYSKLLNNSYAENESQAVINQHNAYNYNLHDRERDKAQKSNIRLMRLLFILSVLLLSFLIVILYLKNLNKKNKIELHSSLENLNRLKLRLSISENREDVELRGAVSSEVGCNQNVSDFCRESVNANSSVKELRERLRKELLSIQGDNCNAVLSPIISQSQAYIKLQDYIKQEKYLADDNELWDELEDAVLKASPNFKSNLTLLTLGRFTSIDIHTALLIKCQVLPSQMAVLLNRSKGAIVSRRENLCIKIFDEKLGTKIIDGIIRLL